MNSKTAMYIFKTFRSRSWENPRFKEEGIEREGTLGASEDGETDMGGEGDLCGD